MIDKATAEAAADALDLDAIGACQACLLELAWAIDERRPPPALAGLVTTTANWIWFESEDAIRVALARARMRGSPHAAAALADVDERAWRSRVVRALVVRLASRLADELTELRAR